MYVGMGQAATTVSTTLTCPVGQFPDMGVCVSPAPLTLSRALKADVSGIGSVILFALGGVAALAYLVFRKG